MGAIQEKEGIKRSMHSGAIVLTARRAKQIQSKSRQLATMPVRRLLPVRGEDHVQGGHVARVAGVGELVEDDLGGQIQ